ncbi:MAG: DUF5020 family protein [Bacteroidales bacterium]|nr:DUF5020 family protein [Bacteroidales bacterium]
MIKKSLFIACLAILAFSAGLKAQTNLQVFYDFGQDRNIVTTTLEGFHTDKWGNTFFFIDYDYTPRQDAPDGTYFEIARCLNFWQDSALGALSLQIEYNGGVYSRYGINHAALAGLDYFIHSKDFKNTLNLKVLYKWMANFTSQVPMQFTAVWGMDDLFGLEGLRFSGFADFWWQDQRAINEFSRVVFISEPQLWYNVGRHFGVPNFNIGGEVELSYNFGGAAKGFWARPCAGLKWIF